MKHASLRALRRGARRRAPAALAALLCAMLIGGAQAAPPWHGFDVPDYPGAQNLAVHTDSDEYTLYFNTGDAVAQVFDYYRYYLQRQGFAVSSSQIKEPGVEYKAKLRRGDAVAAEDRVEMDAKLKDDADCTAAGSAPGCVKVEIEIDE